MTAPTSTTNTKTLELALRLNEHQQQATTCSTTTKMFLLKPKQRRTSRLPSSKTSSPHSTRLVSLNQSTTTSRATTPSCLLLISLLATLLLACVPQNGSGQYESAAISLLSNADQQQQQLATLSQTSEILVQPNSARRIECRLPSLEKSSKRLFHWNLVRSSTGKMNILCVRDECPEDSALGIQLRNDSLMGAYDLFIPRVSYDLHDGLYSCYYRDAELNQTINKDYRLTVLSKYFP